VIKVNTQIHRLATLAREALNKSGPLALDDARRSFDEIGLERLQSVIMTLIN